MDVFFCVGIVLQTIKNGGEVQPWTVTEESEMRCWAG